MLVLPAVPTGALIGPSPFIELEGGIGSGACDRLQVDADCQDIEDCPELVDQMEACPEEPELVDETEIRGRWLNAAWGGRNMAVSRFSLAYMSTRFEELGHRLPAPNDLDVQFTSSEMTSCLTSAVGVVAVEEPLLGVGVKLWTLGTFEGIGGGGGHRIGGGGASDAVLLLWFELDDCWL